MFNKKNTIILLTLVMIIILSCGAYAAKNNYAKPTNLGVIFNGNKVDFQAYNIDGNNYLKISDIAKLINSEVKYDSISNTVSINTESIVYNNEKYGFKFVLPKSWENYTILTDKWEAKSLLVEENGVVAETGTKISIRHPKWISQTPRQDIPILILTINQWDKLQNQEFAIGASPILPSELSRNSKYVFSLPARYNFAFPLGFEEVENILAKKPLQVL